MRLFNSVEEAKVFYKEYAYKKFEKKVNQIGFSTPHLLDLSVDQLRVKIDEIDEILSDEKRLIAEGEIQFYRGKDFSMPKSIEEEFVGFHFNIGENFLNKKKEILQLIKIKEQKLKIGSLSELIESISQQDLKLKFSEELKGLQEQASRLAVEERQLDEDTIRVKSIKDELEISKSKLDILDKKSQIWLRILGKESIASILGGLILFIMTICLLIAMFMQISATNIVESAFLLILGYFFGQATSSKTN